MSKSGGGSLPPALGFCPICGFSGGARNGLGRCVDLAECSHRQTLEQLGRPRSSACDCHTWPCPCACHRPRHEPF